MELLLGASDFWERLKGDIAAARSEVVVQMMTFEGDETGLALADALNASPAPKRRVLVDSYTRHVQSDKFIYGPGAWFDGELRAEVASTRAMFAGLEEAGGEVRFTNPAGFLYVHMPARNHKKLIVIDGRVSYIGGFNFSDHNFSWHDMMIRIEDPELAAFLLSDFDATWRGEPRAAVGEFPGGQMFMLDGVTNDETFQGVIEAFESAQRSVVIISPYFSFPFTDRLAALPERGVKVTLITPRDNNKGLLRDYVLWEAERYGFELQMIDGMSHMKAALIDDDQLIVGSSNFDFLSYRIEGEIVGILRDRAVIEDFKRIVLEPDLARCEPHRGPVRGFKGRMAFMALKVVDFLARLSLALRRP